MMKRVLSMILAAVCLLVLPLPATAAIEEERIIRFLDDLIGLLYQEELLYEDTIYVLDAMERFDEEKSWDNLQKARAMLYVARHDIAILTPPETSMDMTDQMAFLDAGLDISVMETAATGFRAEQTEMLNAFMHFRSSLLLDVFLVNDWETARRNNQIHREITEARLQYYANLTDWVLMLIDSPELEDAFRQMVAEYCPLIAVRQAENPVSMEENEASTDALLRHMEELKLEADGITGSRTDRNNRLQEQIEAGAWKEIRDNIMPVSGTPGVFAFYPPGMERGEESYCWSENGAFIPTPLPAAMPDRKPDACVIRIPDVSLEEAKEYQQNLALVGLNPVETAEEGDIWSLTYQEGDSIFTLTWENGAMTIQMLTEPVFLMPVWFPLTLQAQ